MSTGLVQAVIASVPYVLVTADPAVGDVDGDRRNEIVFSGPQSGTWTYQVLVMDDARSGYTFLPVHYSYPVNDAVARNETGDVDGDGVAGLVSTTHILDDVTTAQNGVLARLGGVPHEAVLGNTVMAVGDVTGDMRDDVVYVNGTFAGDKALVVYGADSAGNWTTLRSVVPIYDGYPTITTVNTDDDSALVEFQGQELLFTDPRIVAVLAAPPSYRDIAMDMSLAGTSFGRGTGYYYEVLSSPVPAEVGSTMVINVPRELQTLFVDREFYNDRNGDFPDVDATVLAHTVGDPRSYPNEASVDKEKLRATGGYYSDSMTVGQGSGSQAVEIQVSNGEGEGHSFDLDVGVSAELGTGGFVIGTSFGFHYGYSYRITSTASTYYAGTVGNILDSAQWTGKNFDFGLYVKPTTLGGQKFPLIGYWVD